MTVAVTTPVCNTVALPAKSRQFAVIRRGAGQNESLGSIAVRFFLDSMRRDYRRMSFLIPEGEGELSIEEQNHLRKAIRRHSAGTSYIDIIHQARAPKSYQDYLDEMNS